MQVVAGAATSFVKNALLQAGLKQKALRLRKVQLMQPLQPTTSMKSAMCATTRGRTSYVLAVSV
jgi:hypothetical protein